MQYVRVITDAEGRSRFMEADVTMERKDFAPPAAPMQVSEFQAARRWALLRLPVAWDGSWHPTPVRQLIVCMTGQLEITVGDGQSRRFGPGEMVMLEDTTGKGHVTKVIGSQEAECLAVQL